MSIGAAVRFQSRIIVTQYTHHKTLEFKYLNESFISPEIFIYFFINSDSNLTQTQMLTLKLSPN